MTNHLRTKLEMILDDYCKKDSLRIYLGTTQFLQRRFTYTPYVRLIGCSDKIYIKKVGLSIYSYLRK